MINFRSFADMNLAIVNNLHRIDRTKFDVVVGIPRSGMIPASLICTHLQKPLSDVESFAAGRAYERFNIQAHGRRVLLVDDSVNKGRAMEYAVNRIKARASSIIRLGVYGPYQLVSPQLVVDISLEHCQGPRVFQWNMWKHIRLSRWSFDFDGVFCRDPTNDENDDGPKYENFLRNVEPVFIPSRDIGHIITGRLEKYRSLTEGWLAKYGIKYASLQMMPYLSKQERMEAGGRGAWKASVLKRLESEFYIESNPKQAGIIARETGLQVWCTTTQTLFGSNS
jgi:hypoxanthine phosphoribosyltransferase/uncharacterized HAD superfamily protein